MYDGRFTTASARRDRQPAPLCRPSRRRSPRHRRPPFAGCAARARPPRASVGAPSRATPASPSGPADAQALPTRRAGHQPDIEVGSALTEAGFRAHARQSVASWPTGRRAMIRPRSPSSSSSSRTRATSGVHDRPGQRLLRARREPRAGGPGLRRNCAGRRARGAKRAATGAGQRDDRVIPGVARLLGTRTAELHKALAAVDDPASRPSLSRPSISARCCRRCAHKAAGTFVSLRHETEPA